MKRFCICAFAAMAFSAQAYDFSVPVFDDMGYETVVYYSFNADGRTVSVAQPPQPYSSSYIEIPASVTYEGMEYAVTAIGANAFEQASVSTVKLPQSVSQLLPEAFRQSSVKTVEGGEGLVAIGNQAFYNSKIATIGLQDGLESIGSYAFAECKNLTEMMLPATLEELGNSAFSSTGLRSVSLPAGLKTLRDNTFWNCRSLLHVDFSEGLEEIGSYAFYWCPLTDGVVLPESLLSIGYRGFYDSDMPSVEFGSSLRSIGSEAFGHCQDLSEAMLPDSVTELGQSCFDYCTSMQTIEFSAGLIEIPYQACSGCKSLVKVSIPEGVVAIGGHAFSGCKLLSTVKLPSTLTSFKSLSGSENVGGGNFSETALSGLDLPEGITELPNYFFSGCNNLVTYTIPERITSIGQAMFRDCGSLQSVVLPDGLVEIPASCFDGCSSLSTITWPTNLRTIQGSAFHGCSSLASLELPESLEAVYGYAFEGCTAITEVVFPPYVKETAQSIFSQCTALKSVTFSPSAQVVTNCFNSCLSLETVHMPRAVPPMAGVFGGIYPAPIVNEGSNVVLYVPTGAKAAYEADQYWNTFRAIEEEEVAGVVYGFTAAVTGQGRVTVNGQEASYISVGVESGGEAVIAFIPYDGRYVLDSAALNGTDITALLSPDGTYTVTGVEQNYRVQAVFANAPVQVKVYSGESGIMTFPVKYGSDFAMTVEAAGGWRIEAVYWNGTDITATIGADGALRYDGLTQNAEVHVVYSKLTDSTGASVQLQAKVFASGTGIFIEGLEAGQPWSVCDASGIMIGSGISAGSTVHVDAGPGIRMVCLPGRTVKIAF